MPTERKRSSMGERGRLHTSLRTRLATRDKHNAHKRPALPDPRVLPKLRRAAVGRTLAQGLAPLRQRRMRLVHVS